MLRHIQPLQVLLTLLSGWINRRQLTATPKEIAMHIYCGLVVCPERVVLCIGTDAETEEWTLVSHSTTDDLWSRLEPLAASLVCVCVEGANIEALCRALRLHGLEVYELAPGSAAEIAGSDLTVEQRAVKLAGMAKTNGGPRWPPVRWRRLQPNFILPPLLIAVGVDMLDAPSRWMLGIQAALVLGLGLYALCWFYKNPGRFPFSRFWLLLIDHHPADEPDYRPVMPRGRLSAVWPVAAIVLVGATALSPIQGIFIDFLFCAGLAVLAGWIAVRLRGAIGQAALPLTMAILFGFTLQADQSVEVLRVVNESPLYVRVAVYFAWLISIFFLSLILFKLTWRAFALTSDARLFRKQKIVAALIVGVPYLGAIVSVWNALTFTRSPYIPDINWMAISFITSAAALAIASLVAIAKGSDQLGLVSAPRPEDPIGRTLLAAILMFMAIYSFGYLARIVGYSVEPAAVLLLTGWFAIATAFFYLVGKIGRIVGVPAILFMTIWALLLSALDLNDNHELSFARSGWRPPLATDAFDQWLGRTDKGGISPTAFIVVSEGGGARAEYMTAVALEALRTRCAAFSRHHFATIGVSGGSVGAALSAMSSAAAAPDCAHITAFKTSESIAVSAAGIDLLGPALRGFLLHDLGLQLWPSSLWRTQGQAPPGSVIRTGDRTQYMEEALGRTFLWQDQPGIEARLLFSGLLKENERHKAMRPQDRLFSSAWDGPNGDKPALILLTTDVASGRRIAASHFRFTVPSAGSFQDCLPQILGAPDAAEGHLLSFGDIMPGREPTLIGASLASARFPIISPPATLPCSGPPWRVVDGGYFENSGLTTALELIENMAAGAKQHGLLPRTVRVVLIRVENGAAITGRPTKQRDRPPPAAFAELLSPIRAFGGTREARAELSRLSVDQAVARGSYGTGCDSNDTGGCVQLGQAVLRLAPCEVPIPLGWSLSEGAKAEIRQQLGIESAHSSCVAAIGRQNRGEFERIFALAKH